MLKRLRRLLRRAKRPRDGWKWSDETNAFVPLAGDGEEELTEGVISAHQRLVVDDIGVLGFIPREADTSSPAPEGLHPRLRLGTWLLHRTGNRRPPDRFDAIGQLRAYLEKRDCRGASWLRCLHVYRSLDGRVIGFRGRRGWHTGFTPYAGLRRAGVGRLLQGRLHFSADGKSLKISHPFAFKIGEPGNTVGRLVLGHWAPWALMSIEYTIHSEGHCRVEVTGTAVPAQHLYVGWRRAAVHAMPFTGDELSAFITAGDCRFAPCATRLRWSGRAPSGLA